MNLLKYIAILLVLPSLSWAQSTIPTSSLPPASPRILTDDDLRAFLVGTNWTWISGDGHTDEKMQFSDDGSVYHTYFVAKFSVHNSHEVDFRIKQSVAKLKFDSSYTHYVGTDFNGVQPIHGERLMPPVTPPATTAAVPSEAETKATLVGNTWSFEALQFHYKAYRKFAADGTWISIDDPYHGTWKIEGNKLLISVTVFPSTPEEYTLPLKKAGWAGFGRSHDPLVLGIADNPPASGTSPTPSYFGNSQH